MSNRTSAILVLMRDGRNEKPSKASLRRVQKACKEIGLDEYETRIIETALEYRPSPEDELYILVRDCVPA